jgi:hypothetical protein
LSNEYTLRMNQLVRQAGLTMPLVAVPADAPTPPDVARMASAVGDYLVAQGDDAASEVRWCYDLVYRHQSAFGVHGGLAAVSGHLTQENGWLGVSAERLEADASGELLWGATLLHVLARRVFLEFGIGVADLDETGAPIRDAARRLNNETERQSASPPSGTDESTP